LVLAFAAFGLVMSLVMLAVDPKPIVGLDATQRQDAETLLYLMAFAVILPSALIVVPRLADAIAAGPNAPGLASLVALLASGLAAAVVLARLSDVLTAASGTGALLGAVGLWWVVAAAALARSAGARRWPGLLKLARLEPSLWVLAAALAVGTLLTVTHLDSVSPLAIALGVAVVPGLVLLAGRRPLPALRARWGAVADLLAVGVLLLAIPDLVVITPGTAASDPLDPYITAVAQFHQDFILGPANQMLGGSGMLVDTASQYGVGSVYFVVGWFELAPIGYGTFGLLDGILTALLFVAGYCLLRLAGLSRLLAASALAVAVVALVLNRVYPVGALPQEGPLRFGLPLPLIVALVAGARWPRHAPAAQAAAVGVVALSSIWSLEAFAVTAATFAVMVAFQARLRPDGGRLRWLARQAALAATACIGVHLLFAVATLAGTGQLPDWGQYLAYLHAFLFGGLGDLTYDFSRWSPGLAVGAVYLASAAAIVLLLRRRPGLVRRARVTLLALTGTTAYGIFLFSYYVDRSGDHVLPYVSLPALLVAALWLGMVLRPDGDLARTTRAGVLTVGLSVAVLLVAVAWSSIGARFERSALAHAFPGGESARVALDRLWHFPPLSAKAVQGERLLDRFMPGERRSLVLVRQNLDTEILMRSGRANRVDLGDPLDYEFVAEQRVPGVRDTVAALQPGQRLLLDQQALDALRQIRTDPAFDPLHKPNPAIDPLTRSAPVSKISRLQAYALQEINERFRLRPIYRDQQGFVVAELRERP
jgi:hypothetical protein